MGGLLGQPCTQPLQGGHPADCQVAVLEDNPAALPCCCLDQLLSLRQQPYITIKKEKKILRLSANTKGVSQGVTSRASQATNGMTNKVTMELCNYSLQGKVGVYISRCTSKGAYEAVQIACRQ